MPQNLEDRIIDGCKIHLMPKVELEGDWVGNDGLMRQLAAAWLVTGEGDRPMNPVIVGSPGCGKTSLVAAMAKELKKDLYIFQCTMDTRPEDLLITPVLTEDRTVRYQASSLVTAMLTGGICILDEGNRMRDKAWASLAPLLDARRYVESIVTGIRIQADPEFRIAATMNEDASVYNLPEYIKSRLRPRIMVPEADHETLSTIIKTSLPFVDKKVLDAVLKFLKLAENKQKAFSIRQAVQLADLANKICAQNADARLEEVVKDTAWAVADVDKIEG